ncbi:DNA polymerase III subunit epsilon [Pseudoalteromonas peptidolytica]|nr:DNA polymerase III subunit epsilon [Pseudoalteromonas peptidolytica]
MNSLFCRLLRKELPNKYYLGHFNELLGYLQSTCQSLLSDKQHSLLQQLQRLPENELCLLVRFMSRKTPFIDIRELNYKEIADIETVSINLRKMGLLRPGDIEEIKTLLSCQTKPKLILLAEVMQLEGQPAKSAKKATWIDHLLCAAEPQKLIQQSSLAAFLTLSFLHDVDYFLFLYFGKLGYSLGHFSMRDLGVMQTRTDTQVYHAHFEHRSEATSAFYYAAERRTLEDKTPEELIQQSQRIASHQVPEVIGSYAEAEFSKYVLLLAQKLGVESPIYAELLEVSGHPKAEEVLIRFLYKSGNEELARQRLEKVIEGQHDETLMIFAEDFYERKFNKKRTSILTDMLRASPPPISIEEAYKGQTEAGVIAHYKRQGINAYHVENKLWLSLFGLTFWQELYRHPKSIMANEFSKTPSILKENRFYEVLEAEIDERLAKLSDAQVWRMWLLKQMSEHYAEPNRLFHWHEKLLEPIEMLLKHIPVSSLKKVLQMMCKNFNSMRSGFPDLMVIDQQSRMRFEEIKAPGDSLSRSQLVNISKLLNCGIPTAIKTVKWQITPDQPYVVVDVETTGGNKDFDRITEIALVKVINGEIVDKWQSLINPMRRIPQRITELTGITQSMVTEAPRFAEVIEKVEQFCLGAIFVAHNVNFDYGFVKHEFLRANVDFYRAKLCTVTLARQLIPGLHSYALAPLSKSLGVSLKDHHRAMADALAAAEIFIHINQLRLAR